MSSSRTLLRTLLEAVFTLCAIAKQDDVLERYIKDDDIRRLKLNNAVQASTSPTLVLAKAGEMHELKRELETKVAGGPQAELGVEELARKAGLHDWYVAIYRILSQAAHVSVRDLESYFILSKSGDEVEALRLEPSDSETDGLLKSAGSFLLTALNATAVIFPADLGTVNQQYDADFDNGFSRQ